MRRTRGTGLSLLGAGLALMLVVVALIGPLLVADPDATDIANGLDALGGPLSPSADAWLGTDALGRDVLARVVAGAATSLWVAALATVASLAIGLAIGLVAGYTGGRVDGALMRLVDLVLAFPTLLLAILLATLLRERGGAGSSAPVVATLAIVGWTPVARVVRNQVRVLARGEMALAARSLGASSHRIVTRYLLPNVGGIVLAIAALVFAQNLLAESVLSYLGLGPPPPAPTWGRMIYEGRTFYRTSPHLVIAPGVAIVLAVAAFQLLAEQLRRRTGA